MYQVQSVLIVSLLLSHCVSYENDYAWFQGTWISDAERTLEANPDILDSGTEELEAYRSVFEKLIWTVDQTTLKQRHPESKVQDWGTYTFKIVPVSHEEFTVSFEGGDDFSVYRTEKGFCARYKRSALDVECFEPYDT